MDSAPELEIVGLSRRDRANLLEHLPEKFVRFQAPPVKLGELGDPSAMVATICLTAVSLSGLFAWLAMHGTSVNAQGTIKIPGTEATLKLELGPHITEQAVKSELAQHGVEIK